MAKTQTKELKEYTLSELCMAVADRCQRYHKRIHELEAENESLRNELRRTNHRAAVDAIRAAGGVCTG